MNKSKSCYQGADSYPSKYTLIENSCRNLVQGKGLQMFLLLYPLKRIKQNKNCAFLNILTLLSKIFPHMVKSLQRYNFMLVPVDMCCGFP